jgi:hypothetical protein
MVPSMETTYLTIAEAVAKTGRSASTIRRVIHAITKGDDHPDRAAVQPSPEEVEIAKQKGETFTWRIREDLLLRDAAPAAPAGMKKKLAPSGDILNVLQSELELKNRQIEKQWEVIHALNERLREGNILMGSLQKRLGPPEPAVSEPVMTAAVADSSMVASEVPSKKGFLAWLRS